jgi:hypothetical protein
LSDTEQKVKENRREGEDLGYYCIVIPGNGALQKKKRGFCEPRCWSPEPRHTWNSDSDGPHAVAFFGVVRQFFRV